MTANAAGKTTAVVGATAALEASAGLIGRAFSAAEITGPPMLTEHLTPELMNMIGRSMVRKGELIAEIDVMGGRVRYHPAASHTVLGGIDPESWIYRCSYAGPQRQKTTRRVMSEGVLHFIYSASPETPWRGQSAMTTASLGGRLSAETTAALADESSGPRGAILPIPADPKGGNVELQTDLDNLKGKVAMIEAGSWNAVSDSDPDWKPRRVGAAPPDSLVRQAELATSEIYAACGINPAIFRDADGTAGREAWRQLLFGTIAPLGGIVQAELQAQAGCRNYAILGRTAK